ncbi:MAG: PqqD family protein [Myxococcales bacterium]|nr:PqqD family protein [Myxococcales bacterium]
MEIPMNAVPRVHSEAGVQRVGGRFMATSPDDSLHTFEDEGGQVSEVAERIIELVDGQRTLAQIVEVLCEEFEVEREPCASDTARFVELLVEKKVLVL